ncbi:unnamed protein product [Discula destructiva]
MSTSGGRPPTARPRRSSSHLPTGPNDDSDHESKLRLQTPISSRFLRASAPPTSTTRFSIHTPGSQILPDLRRSNLHSASATRSAGKYGSAVPTHFTPHGRAAIRAMDSRRAALNDINTPGRNRRRSVRDQRETPRDVLRALSKALAVNTDIISSKSSSSSPGYDATVSDRIGRKRGRVIIPEDPEDSDDEFPIDRPRFSLPMDEDADSDGDLPRPPRSSGLEDIEDNYTMQSIEGPRRAITGPGHGRFSMRTSMGDLQSDDDGDGGFDSALFPRLNWDVEAGDAIGEDDDATLVRIDDEDGRRVTMLGARISDFGAIDVALDTGDQSTVMMAPQIESSPRRGDSPSNNEPFGFDDAPSSLDDDHNELEVQVDTARSDRGRGDYDEDMEAYDVTTESVIARQVPKSAKHERLNRPGKKISRHGIEYPSLPSSVIRRLAQRFVGKAKISSDTLNAIIQASDWFFEQLGADLRAYANHAKGRTTINDSDMLMLLRRQRQTSPSATPFALAQKHLPRELVQELRMPAPASKKKRSRQAINAGDEVT